MEVLRAVERVRRGGLDRLALTLGLGTFVCLVYAVVVLGGGALIGRTGTPSTALSVLATAAVALSFAPVHDVLERATARWGGAVGPAPYDVLNEFSSSMAEVLRTERLPERMAMLLAQGTGAEWAQVWLRVSDRLSLAATWPEDAEADPSPPSSAAEGRRRELEVRHRGQLLGVLRLHERPGLPLTTVEQRLFSGLAAQAGLVLRLVALRTELESRRAELTARAAELTASRERLIQTQDAERRRLERDLHDGAQQHLVALAVNLRLAETIARSAPERAALVLAGQVGPAHQAIQTLSALSRGIYPRLLTQEGLVAALRSTMRSTAIAVSIDGRGVGRLPPAVEAALYFCCVEAVQNAAKHSGGDHVAVELSQDPDSWRLTITDAGTGFDARSSTVTPGAGLANMQDRLDAVGGTVSVLSGSGRGTTVAAVVNRAAHGDGGGVAALAAGRVS